MILTFLAGVVRQVPITNQIAEVFEMQYHKKNLIDYFDFLHPERPSSKISKKIFVCNKRTNYMPKVLRVTIRNFLRMVCLIVLIFWMDTQRSLRELWIYITVLNDFFQIYLRKFPKRLQLIKKECLVQVFSCEFYKILQIFLNTFFCRVPPVVACFWKTCVQTEKFGKNGLRMSP